MTALAPAAGPSRDGALLTRGLVLMIGSMVFLPAMDAVAKLASAHVPPGEINWVRFALQAVFALPMLIASEGWRAMIPNRVGMNLVRGATGAAASCMFFTAIKYMPLADAIAIFFVEPFIVMLLSPLVEHAELGWRRFAAVAMGFVGAVIVIRPSYGIFGPVALLPLGAAALFAVYVILNKRCAAYDPPFSMQFSAGIGGTLLMTVVLALGAMLGIDNLTPILVSPADWGALALMGLFGTVGHLMLVGAFHRAPAAVLAPFQYLEIVGATVYGYLLFGDFPDWWKWVGILIIVGSGAYVFWRESRIRHA